MKRLSYLLVMAVLAAGTLAAQNRGVPGPSWSPGFGPGRGMPGPYGPSGPRRNREQAPETVTVRGTLGFSDGYISLEQDDTTYYVVGLGQLIGFVDGLKEGAQVTLEGYVFTPQRDTKIRFFRVGKLTFNGKEYGGLSPAFREPDGGRQFPPNTRHYHHYL